MNEVVALGGFSAASFDFVIPPSENSYVVLEELYYG